MCFLHYSHRTNVSLAKSEVFIQIEIEGRAVLAGASLHLSIHSKDARTVAFDFF